MLQRFPSKGGRRAELKIEPKNHFAADMDHFSEWVVNDRTPRTLGEEGPTDVRVLAAIDESIRTAKAASIIL